MYPSRAEFQTKQRKKGHNRLLYIYNNQHKTTDPWRFEMTA